MSGFLWFLVGAGAGAASTWALTSGKRVITPCDTTFRRVHFADITNTSMRAAMKAPYARMVAAFGEPEIFSEDDPGKTRHEWTFRGPGGVYTIYDYKSDGSKGKTTSWHIGAAEDYPELFLAWVEMMLKSRRLSASA